MCCEFTYYTKDQHLFTVDALDRKKTVIKEYNGCYFHGCRKCHQEGNEKYNKTMERKTLLESQGTGLTLYGTVNGRRSKRSYQKHLKLKLKKKQKRNIYTHTML